MLGFRRGRQRGLAALLGAGLLGCAPTDVSGPVTAYVLARDEATGEYALGKHPVDNLESLRELRGRDVDMRKGTCGAPFIDKKGICEVLWQAFYRSVSSSWSTNVSASATSAAGVDAVT